MGLIPITAAGHASWALGVAKSMIDDVTELAATKVRMGDDASIANRASFQRNLSHHLAMWKAAHLLVVTTFGDVEQAVVAGGRRSPRPCGPTSGWRPPSPPRRAARSSSGPTWPPGTSAIREGSRLERAFRDMYTGTQHVFIGEKTYIDAAKIYLGLVEDQFGF